MNKEVSKDKIEQVLNEWKKVYVEAIIDELKPSGSVLEVGFNFGYVADRIQHFHPKNHTIIESDPKFIEVAREWSKKFSNVTLIDDSWEHALMGLGQFDTIFYHGQHLDIETELLKRVSPEDVASAGDKAKELLTDLDEQLSQVEVRYSDEEIDGFCRTVGKSRLEELPQFFKTLKEKGYITAEQYKRANQKYRFETEREVEDQEDPMLIFLEDCLKNHMRKGSRFSCFLYDSTSKYEDSQFFNLVITNPDLEYHEKLVSIEIPNCEFNQGLIILIEKIS